VPQLLASGIRTRHLDNASIERAMEELALRQTPLLHKRLGVLDTVITMAPLLGLLGTITA
jgi:biopolymer transport protein ExbB